MTHGDAVMIIKRRTDSIEKRMAALKLIFNNESKHDFDCLSKRDLWETVKFLFEEIHKTKS